MNGSQVIVYRNGSMTAMISNPCDQNELVMCNENEWEPSNCNVPITSDHSN